MENELFEMKERLIASIFRIKRFSYMCQAVLDTKMEKHGISMAELTLMKAVRNNVLDSDENTGISDIQRRLFTSKAAISKMLGVLERKGYLVRDINRQNRRALIITLTPEGHEILRCLEKNINDKLIEITAAVGKADVEQLIESINRFADTAIGVIDRQ